MVQLVRAILRVGVSVAVIVCGDASRTVAEQTPAAATPLPNALVELLESVSIGPVRRFSTADFGRERVEGNLSAIVPERESEERLKKVRSKLPAGYVAFIGTSKWFGSESPNGIELVVAPGRDKYDIIRAAKSDAVNYDMGTEDLIRHLKELERYALFEILSAETDTITLALRQMPKDSLVFAKEVYEFCPDMVEQEIGSVEALEEDIRKTKRVRLWWD